MNIKFKSIIVDDEKASRDLISFFLYRHQNVQVVDQCGTVKDAITLIDKHNPDIVFLDMEMPGGTGLELLQHYGRPKFKTIIITAYNQYAISALRLAAYDYILKPLNRNQLEEAITRYAGEVEEEHQQISVGGMIDNKVLSKLIIKSDGVYKVMHLKDIYYFKAEGAYTFVQCNDKRHVVSHNLKYFEEILPDNMFHRTHKSYIVNYLHVVELKTGRSGEVTMTNGAKLQVASRRLSIFKHWYFQRIK